MVSEFHNDSSTILLIPQNDGQFTRHIAWAKDVFSSDGENRPSVNNDLNDGNGKKITVGFAENSIISQLVFRLAGRDECQDGDV